MSDQPFPRDPYSDRPLDSEPPPYPPPEEEEVLPDLPRLQQPRHGRRLARKPESPPSPLTAEQRLLLLDTWLRSGLPAGDFAPLVGVSKHTLLRLEKEIRHRRAGGTDGQAPRSPRR